MHYEPYGGRSAFNLWKSEKKKKKKKNNSAHAFIRLNGMHNLSESRVRWGHFIYECSHLNTARYRVYYCAMEWKFECSPIGATNKGTADAPIFCCFGGFPIVFAHTFVFEAGTHCRRMSVKNLMHEKTKKQFRSCCVLNADSDGVNQMREVPEKEKKNKENYAKDFHMNDATENWKLCTYISQICNSSLLFPGVLHKCSCVWIQTIRLYSIKNNHVNDMK